VLTVALKNLNATTAAGSGEGTTIVMGQDTDTFDLIRKGFRLFCIDGRAWVQQCSNLLTIFASGCVYYGVKHIALSKYWWNLWCL
jgi:hypothetical protein